VPAAHRFRLTNGLQVLLVEKHNLPLIAVRMTIKQGAASDPPPRIGLAGLVAAMLEEGAGKRTSLQVADQLDFLAADLEAAAGYEHSTVQLSALKQSFRPAFDLFADAVLRPRFEAREFSRVRKEHLADLAQQRTEPEEVARLVFRRAVYGDRHPYGRPLAGYPATVRAVRRSDLRQFHHSVYRPDQAVLVAVGDLTPAELRPLMQRAFGSWQAMAARVSPPERFSHRRGAEKGRTRLSSASLAKRAVRKPSGPRAGAKRPRLVLVPFAGAPQSVLRIGHPGPSRLSPDYTALEALNVILGGAFTSRLNQNLRERHGYTYGAGSQFAWERGPGPFVVATSVFRNQTGPALAECLSELTKIRDGTITPDELRMATATVRQERVRELADVGGILAVFSEESEYGLPIDDTARLLARLMILTTDDLHRAAVRDLHPDRATVVIVGDLAAIRTALTAARLGPPEVRDVDGAPPRKPGGSATTRALGTK
jgi:zinc protease